jgi:uncharacterized protein involved in exopolysaccharide biosynthesis
MFWRSRSGVTEKKEEVENDAPLSIEASRPRRRMKVILMVALSGALGGFLISYVFPARYTSQSTVLVEGQKIPDEYVHPVITGNFTQRIQTVSQEVISASRLRPVIQSLALVKPEDEGKLISDIQQNMQVEPVITSMSFAAANSPSAARTPDATAEPVPGFNVEYTDSNPIRAQKICNAMTSLIVDENLRERAGIAQSTVEFLSRQLEDAKRSLDEQDATIAAFKKKYLVSQSRTAMSPDVEEQYKLLTRDNDTAQTFYKNLLAKKLSAELGASMEMQQEGEQMNILAPANLPESPDFPNRPLFALGGLGLGLILGIGRALWPARKVKAELQAAVPHGDSAVEANPPGLWP